MEKPAIVLITCDELKRDVLGYYGNEAIETPSLDRLAQSGTRFDKCYTVSPWCLPARCAMLTGQYPHNTGAYSNFRPTPLDADCPNIFTSLKGEGYRTSLFGKCHFVPVPYSETRADRTLPYDEFRDYYLSLGIDHLDLQDDKQVSIWYYDDYSKELDKAGYLKAYRDHNWDKKNQLLYPFPAPAEWHPDIWVRDKTLEFINNDNESDEPLFAWVSFSGPHYPFDTPAEYLDRVNKSKLQPRIYQEHELDDPGRIHHKNYHGGGNIDGANPAVDRACKNYDEDYWERLRVSYNANVALIDEAVGQILDAVKEKYGDNVLVLFTADHGEMLGNHGIWGKHNCAYEEVWHIPLLAKFPFREGGEVTDALVNLNDLLPTILEWGGVEPIPCDGESLTKRIEDGGLDYSFAEGEGYAAVTDGRYKYVHIQKPGENYQEFLDLGEDPHEFENRIDHPECAPHLARLRGKMIEHLMPKVLP